MTLRSIYLFILLALAADPSLPAQRGRAPAAPGRPSQPVAREMAVEYRQLIDRFLDGEAESAVNVVKNWQATSVQVVQRVQAWDRMTLRAAALLETDAAFARSQELARPFGRPNARNRPTLETGSRLMLALGWLDLADKILPQDKSPFRRQWQVAVGRALLREDFLGLADMILGDASLVFPNDPDVLLAYGTVRETAALQFTADVARSIKRSSGTTFFRHDQAMLVREARRVFGRALKASPDSREVRLRLANLRLLQSDDDAAAALLDERQATGLPPDMAYLTALLRGARFYQAARQIVPTAQSAFIAHAQALRAAGLTRESVDVIRQMLTRETLGQDTWARYPFGLDESRASLDALRDQVKQRRPAAPSRVQAGSVKAFDAGATFDSPGPNDSGRVVLDVLVTRDHRTVTGLAATDFDVRYGDARQHVELSDPQALPFDVRMAIDTGDGLDSNSVRQIVEGMRSFASRLRVDDHTELITFADEIRLAAGLTADRERLHAALGRLEKTKGTALFDATFTALALPTRPDRRTLLLVFTAGLDTGSWLPPTAPIDAAAASPVIVYAVIAPDPDLPLRQTQLDVDRLRKWLFSEPMLLREAFLPVLADETGGEVLQPATKDDLAATFADVLSRFQQRYRLSFTPTGVRKPGPQAIEVRMKDRTLTVYARRRHTGK
jgi:VWFA-related protein